jgi:hypothetical protein
VLSRVRRWSLPWAAAACIAVALAPASAPAADPVVFAAGDIACDPGDTDFNGGEGTPTACRQKATADLLGAGTFDAVLALGDLQYNSGTLSSFQRSYDLSWGRVKALTRPVIGNHEGTTATGGSGYCTYFGAAAHCNSGGRQGGAAFYSFDLGAWHVVVLNSNCAAAGGCDAGSAQYEWLAADLAAHPRDCTLAAWHHPRWSSGHDGSNAFMDPIWRLFHERGGDLVLSGHSHDYERFAPIDAAGAVDRTDGIRSFVVGTGGAHFTGIGGTPAPGSEVRQNTSYGVLRLDLRATSYDWRFVPVAGATFADSGRQSCRQLAPRDTRPPSVPADLMATPVNPARIDLSWTASTDDVGVSGYEVWRGSGTDPLARVATTIGTGTAYADGALAAGTAYRYQVRALDAAGNVSGPSATIAAMTPAVRPPPDSGPDPGSGGSAGAIPPPSPHPGPGLRVPAAGAVASPPPAGGRLLARWRLPARAARRALASGLVRIPRRRWALTIIRVRVGGRLAARRTVAGKGALTILLAEWASRRRHRGWAVTVTVRAAARSSR